MADKSIVSKKNKKEAKKKLLTEKVSSPFDFDEDGGEPDQSLQLESGDAELQKLLKEILSLSDKEKDKLLSSIGDSEEEDEDEEDMDIAEPVPMW